MIRSLADPFDEQSKCPTILEEVPIEIIALKTMRKLCGSVANDPSVSTHHPSSQLGISRTALRRIFFCGQWWSRILICGFNKMEQLCTLLGKQ
ncbi:hypothetical protein TNCV_3536091 [Trichonephila clavipes]|uniref:Uncharacterized protein n=1 Tax=Trichonephila clavipes TaxID=2585209 RepID=A0A8X6VWS0_TRICX|nr:hypothetical protein TNCV_3536091 [Trichonephila clavipes]